MKKIIANWKLEKTYAESLRWFTDNEDNLRKLASQAELIISPTALSLDALGHIAKNLGVKLCAQDCSAEEFGPYVGEISAVSLKEINCSYCFVHHSGQQNYQHEDTLYAALKIKTLLKNTIEPVICIGENEHQAAGDTRFRVLEHQLKPFNKVITDASNPHITLAYEPIWAIGAEAGDPAIDAITVFEWLNEYCTTNWPDAQVTYLYGGGINEKNIKDYLHIEHLDGILLGKHGLNFQNFKNIVELIIESA